MSKKKTIIKSLGIGSTLALAMLACAGISQIPEVGNSTIPIVETSSKKLAHLASNNVNQSSQENLEIGFSETYKDHTWTNGEEVEYYGLKYTYDYTYSRFKVSQVDDPTKVETLVLSRRVFGKSAYLMTGTTFDIKEYTNLKNLVLYENPSMFGTDSFANYHVENIYVAYSFNFPYYLTTLTCDNMYYTGVIGGYISDVTNVNCYPEKVQTMVKKHLYYYDYSSTYFDIGASAWKEAYPSALQWEKLPESQSKFNKESFYPCEDYEMILKSNNCVLVHSASSSSFPEVTTHMDMKYTVVSFDDRITSYSVPKIIGLDKAIYDSKTFENLDVRYISLGTISPFKTKTIVYGNTYTNLNGSYINNSIETIYFVKNPNESTVVGTTSNTASVKATKIYIPEADKSYFQAIIDDPNLSPKIEYYSGIVNVSTRFTAEDGTSYRLKNDNADISTCLAGIPNLEMNDITVGPDDYLDEKLLSLGLPTTLEEAETTVFSDIYCTTKANLQTLMDDMFPRLVYTKLGFYQHDYDIDFTINQFDISYTITLADSTVLTGKINIHRYESELGDYAAFYNPDIQRYQLWMNEEMTKPDVFNTSILTEVLQQSVKVETTPTYSPLDLSEGGAVAYEVTTDSETYLFDIIVSEDKFEYTMGQITNQDGTTTDVPVEDQSEAIAGYHITSTIYFTDGFNIDEVLKLIKPYMLYKDGEVVDHATYKTTYSLNATGWLTVKCTNDKDEVLASMMFQPRKVTNSKVDFIYIEQAGYMAKLFVNPTTTTHTMDEIFETAFSTGRVYITRPSSIPTMTMNKACQSDNISSIFMAGNGKYYNYTVKTYVLNISKEIESSTLTIEVPEDLVLATFTPNKGLVGEKEEVEIVKTNPVEDIYNDVVDKVKENKAFQALAIVLGSVLGLGLLWLLWKLIRRIIKFFK